MKRLMHWILCCGLWVAAATQVMAVEVEGHEIPESAVVDGQVLLLNGAAVRKFTIFKVEVAALYLKAQRNTLEGVVADRGPKRLRLVMLRETPVNLMVRKFMSDFESFSTPAEWKAMTQERAVLESMFVSTGGINKGDVIAVDWVPGKGLCVSHNDKPLPGVVANETAYQIILRIFLAPEAQANARDRLLGIKPMGS